MTTQALAPHRPAPVAGATPALPVQQSMRALLEASVTAYGDVVRALLCDLDRFTDGMERLSWLATTDGLLLEEAGYRAAVDQLRWWDAFLARLPAPRLRSDARQAEALRTRALRAQARLRAREAALAEHRQRVALELERPDLTDEEREGLLEVFDDPREGQWRADLARFTAEALAGAPALPDGPPIALEDLDPAHSFAGFTAVEAMRADPVLGPRAAMMDAALAAVLRERFDLGRAAAGEGARQLTGIFWIALRRALQAGSDQLAASIQFVGTASASPVQEQFTRELLQSWLAVLEALPQRRVRPTLGQRLRGLLGKKGPEALPEPRKALVDRER